MHTARAPPAGHGGCWSGLRTDPMGQLVLWNLGTNGTSFGNKVLAYVTYFRLMMGVLLGRGKSVHRDRGTGKGHMKVEADPGALYPQADDARKNPPEEPSERAGPCRHLDFGHPASRMERLPFRASVPSSLWA